MLVLNALVTFALMVITCPTLDKKKKKTVILAHLISDLEIHLNVCAIEQFHLMLIMFMHEKLNNNETALKIDTGYCKPHKS